MSILSTYIKDDDIHNNDFLFRKPGTMKPYTASEFSDLTGSYFEELVGKRMGSTLLRHSFISDVLANYKITDNEKALLAYQMSHSTAVQSTYRVISKEGDNDVLNLSGSLEAEDIEKMKQKIDKVIEQKKKNNKK